MNREKERRDGILEKEDRQEESPTTRPSIPEHRYPHPPEAVHTGSEVAGHQSPGREIQAVNVSLMSYWARSASRKGEYLAMVALQLKPGKKREFFPRVAS